MKLLIVGAGALGCSLAAFLARQDGDAVLLARGETLKTLKSSPLVLHMPDYSSEQVSVCAKSIDEIDFVPDAVFICVKAYSLEEAARQLRGVIGEKTLIIPLLNGFTAGAYLKDRFPGAIALDGCVYIAASKESHDEIRLHGSIFKVVFGAYDTRSDVGIQSKMEKTAQILTRCGIECIISPDIRRDKMLKFSYVSAQAVCGLYYGAAAGEMQKSGECRDMFISLVREIEELAAAMKIDCPDLVERNLGILDSLRPTSSTSLQRDIAAGGRSEADALIYFVVRTAKSLGLTLPSYEKTARLLLEKGIK